MSSFRQSVPARTCGSTLLVGLLAGLLVLPAALSAGCAQCDVPAAEQAKVGEYCNEVHAEDMAGVQVGDYNYKFRTINGLVLPPYVTPSRLNVSQTITTRPEDVCYCSFPKSGSTWLANILYLILNDGIEPKGRPLRSYLHWMESSWTFPRTRDEVDVLPSPRSFKSHMPHSMALGGGPRKRPCKYIYIARNPKDVSVSYFHFESGSAWSGGYNGPWEHWLKIFMEGKVQRGDWFDHVLSWWQQRDADNLLFLKYEDLKRDLRGQLQVIAKYLGRDLSDEIIDRIIDAASFSHMKAAEFSNHKQIADFQGFFRKGVIGSWKDQFTVAQSEAFDQVYKERMQGTGLECEFE